MKSDFGGRDIQIAKSPEKSGQAVLVLFGTVVIVIAWLGSVVIVIAWLGSVVIVIAWLEAIL